jgi:hypothetical protein
MRFNRRAPACEVGRAPQDAKSLAMSSRAADGWDRAGGEAAPRACGAQWSSRAFVQPGNANTMEHSRIGLSHDLNDEEEEEACGT